MLHKDPFIIAPATFTLIQQLQALPELNYEEDIAAMKFHAIIQSGKRLKDFIDIYFLLEHFSMQQMIGFFTSKYTYSNAMIAMKAVNFFDDIDENIDPPKMLNLLSVKKITDRIKEATLNPEKIFKQKK
ncbi:MAG: hypothetical protein ABIP79_00720 [Chitinophagaceae bacterium]